MKYGNFDSFALMGSGPRSGPKGLLNQNIIKSLTHYGEFIK